MANGGTDSASSQSISPAKSFLHPVYTVSNITNKVRVLDGTKVTYASWVRLFTLHARGYKVLSHIDGTPPPSPTAENYSEWCEVDAHVLQWIYGTLSDDLLPRILEDESTAYAAWKRVENIFLNNKGARAAALEHEFNNLKLESMPSLEAYCQRLRDLAGQMKDVGSAVDNQRLVLQLVRGLPPSYDTVAAYINQTLPPFETARSMLELEKHRTSAREEPPAALVAAPAPPSDNSGWGDTSTPNPTSNQNRSSNRGNGNRRRDNRSNQKRSSSSSQTAATQPAAAPVSWPTMGMPYPWSPPPCPYPTYPGWVQPWQQWAPSVSRSTARFNATAPRFGQANLVDTEPVQPTDLAQAFQAMSINAPWFMDTGASSHLTADAGTFDSPSNARNIHSILVGNGHSIPVQGCGPSDWDDDSEE
ncbi:uncharacterized protein LOC141630395 [Silene latifolia]|uniref:uncharacterized protein LOC141630395 n=1 Tax=Silene latifolia TaxID=37657 RepID=UPI003D77E45F